MTVDAVHILVVDDDTRLRELLRKYLADSGFRVTASESAEDARQRLEGLSFDLIILDRMMPGEDGLAFTEWLRPRSKVPILMLTALGEADDRIAGLEGGADDYLVKPFEPRELVLRIKNILRRLPEEPAPDETSLGDFVFDHEREELRRGSKLIRLTSTETRLLKILAENPGVILSREELSRRFTGSGTERTIDVQVNRLRQKIESDPRLPRYLQTVRGRGYVLRPD